MAERLRGIIMIQVTDLNPGKTFKDGENIFVALDVLLNKTH